MSMERANKKKWLDERTVKERDMSSGQIRLAYISDTGVGMKPDSDFSLR
jgi:hypothetical protein